jgi:GTP-binding protein
LNIQAEFITSAADAAGFPARALPEVALVGRSNVGKSSLINALVRQRIARTSATPGKTRLANVYRVRRGTASPFHLVDLPGYGYARGGSDDFEQLTAAYFGRGQLASGLPRSNPARPLREAPPDLSVLLLVDARHPGLARDIEAWRWVKGTTGRSALVATKIDKLARGQRIRALGEFESVFEDSVLPVSAATGEGLDELWKLIDRLANNPSTHRNPHSRPSSPRGATGPRPPKR